MIGFFRDIRDEESGSATIEFAIVAPVLAGLIVGVVDLSMAYSRKLEIEQGAQRAIERVMQTTTTQSVHEELTEEAALAAKVEEDQVAVKYMKECDGVETDITADVEYVLAQVAAGVPDTSLDRSAENCDPGETQRNYLTVTIIDEYYPVIDPRPVGITTNANGAFDITVETGIRTK